MFEQYATVEYQIATYSGSIDVPCKPDDENEHIIAKAKRILRNQCGDFPFGTQQFVITNREWINVRDYIIQIISFATGEIVKEIPVTGERKLEKVENGLYMKTDLDKYYLETKEA